LKGIRRENVDDHVERMAMRRGYGLVEGMERVTVVKTVSKVESGK
jgi:hypothetical protein